MSRLIVLVLLLIPLFTLAIGTALLIGRIQPLSERVEWLHLTDCAPPCWNGITPKVSSRGQLEDRITTTFPQFKSLGSDNLPFLTWAFDDLELDETSINVALDDGLVWSIGIGSDFANAQMPNLGETLAVFGAPACIGFADPSGYATLDYVNASQQVFLEVTAIEPSLSSPVTNITMYASNLYTCQSLFAMSWREFRVSPSYSSRFVS